MYYSSNFELVNKQFRNFEIAFVYVFTNNFSTNHPIMNYNYNK